MPRTINQGFLDFHSKLTPTPGESTAAKNHRASIEASLKANFSLTRFFRTGSFGNGTSIAGYSDVDYFASIPTTNLKNNSDTSLRMVRDVLAARFPYTGVKVSCPAVVVPFGSDAKETTEVVPADYQYSTGSNDLVYHIPDCDGGWQLTSPDAQNEYVRKIDQKLSNKVKPLIRFLKAWKYYNNVPISSFYLEMRVAKYAQATSTIIYSWDVRDIFEHLFDIDLARLQDPQGISGYIYAASTQVKLDEAKSKVLTAYTRAKLARKEEEKGNIKDAFYWWNLLFNYEFPSYYY
jgi:hypothetical protein